MIISLDNPKADALDIIRDLYNELYDKSSTPPWVLPNTNETILYSRYLWTLNELSKLIENGHQDPLMIVDRFKDKMIEYAQINSEQWQDCVDCCGMVTDLLV